MITYNNMELIGVRFTEEEYDLIKDLSKKDNRSMASFVRIAALNKINERASAQQE